MFALASRRVGLHSFRFSSNAINKNIRNTLVFFDVCIGEEPEGRIVFELFDQVVPYTAMNFRNLCDPTFAYGYRNSSFYRIFPESYILGGDFTQNDGTGGCAALPDGKFSHENYHLKHSRRGLLSMANCERGTSNSQFMITTRPTPWMDGKHVVFGIVREGDEVLKKIESLGSSNGQPIRLVTIEECGILGAAEVL